MTEAQQHELNNIIGKMTECHFELESFSHEIAHGGDELNQIAMAQEDLMHLVEVTRDMILGVLNEDEEEY